MRVKFRFNTNRKLRIKSKLQKKNFQCRAYSGKEPVDN